MELATNCKIDTFFDETQGVSFVCLTDRHGRIYEGLAQISPNDLDFQSERTGLSTADLRAQINFYKGYIKNELKPQLRALKQLYYSMNRSKNFDKTHYEVKMLNRAIKRIEAEIQETKDFITELTQVLKDYIQQKDDMYKKLRAKREPTDLADID